MSDPDHNVLATLYCAAYGGDLITGSRLGQKGVNFGNSLTASGACYMKMLSNTLKKKSVYLCPT